MIGQKGLLDYYVNQLEMENEINSFLDKIQKTHYH